MNGENSTTPPEGQPGWQFRPGDSQVSSDIPAQPLRSASADQLPPNPAEGSNPSPSLNQMGEFTPPQPQQSQMANNDTVQLDDRGPASQPEFSWSASEFIAHEKGSLWYVALALATTIIAGLVFLITRDLFSLGAVVLAMAAFGVMAHRKPKTVAYSVGPNGLQANGRVYAYANFKSFGLQDEGTFSSLVFMPMKRFMLPLYVYFPPESRDEIINVLSHYIPFSPVQQGAIDKATHRLRF